MVLSTGQDPSPTGCTTEYFGHCPLPTPCWVGNEPEDNLKLQIHSELFNNVQFHVFDWLDAFSHLRVIRVAKHRFLAAGAYSTGVARQRAVVSPETSPTRQHSDDSSTLYNIGIIKPPNFLICHLEPCISTEYTEASAARYCLTDYYAIVL